MPARYRMSICAARHASAPVLKRCRLDLDLIIIALCNVDLLIRLHPEWSPLPCVPQEFYICGAGLALVLGVRGLVAALRHDGGERNSITGYIDALSIVHRES